VGERFELAKVIRLIPHRSSENLDQFLGVLVWRRQKRIGYVRCAVKASRADQPMNSAALFRC
jgi:hypothetical protein